MILLDDNFYYASMRRAFYRLCRDYEVAYAPVCSKFFCHLKVAIIAGTHQRHSATSLRC